MYRNTNIQIKFPGYLDFGEGKVFHIAATIEYERFDPSSLDIDILLLGDQDKQMAAAQYMRNYPYNYLWLHSDDEMIPSVEIIGMNRLTVGARQVSISARAVQIGLTQKPLLDDQQYLIKIELIPSGILVKPRSKELSFTGEISFNPIVEGEIKVSSKIGPLDVAESFEHYESEEHSNRVTHSVQRATIRADVQLLKNIDLFSFNETLRAIVEEICLMLSLCYRQPIDFYEIRYIPIRKDKNSIQVPESLLRRRLDTSLNKIKEEELINYRGLIDGGLDLLLKSYRNFKQKDELTRGVQFLSSSYAIVRLESAYFLAYSALEAIVSSCGGSSRYLIKSAKWGKVEKRLRTYLDDIAGSEGLEDVVELMKEKLPELRRTPSDRKIIETCRILEVKTDDLWPAQGVQEGVKMATKMRNDLFHSALYKDSYDLYKNLVRLRILAERILLKALRWPDDRIWVWYDQNLKWVNSE
jgi:hypothetical protein